MPRAEEATRSNQSTAKNFENSSMFLAAVSPTTVMKLEHGEITVQFDKILQILDQLSVPLSAIIGFDQERPKTLPDSFTQLVVEKLKNKKLEDAVLLIVEEMKRLKQG